MKKVLALILSALLILGALPAAAFAADDALPLIFVTDIHHHAKVNSVPVTLSTAEDPYGYVVSNGKMTVESAAILDAFLKKAAQSDSEYVIITGDISDNGTEAEVSAVSAKLAAFESESGKTVLACVGNHETYDERYSSLKDANYADRFKQYYASLGFDKALAVDTASASYTVDLNDEYRLIMIDTNNFSQARIDWIEAQVNAAKNDGKTLISVTHFSLFEHYSIQQLAHDSVVDPQFGLADKFIDWGIQYNFSGHTHELDTAVYTNNKGSVYDVTCGALTTYPACWKTAVFAPDKVTLGTGYVTEIDPSLVPDGLQEEALGLMTDDFRAYAKKLFLEGSYRQIGSYITTGYVVYAAKLDYTRDADIIALLDQIVPRAKEALAMPLYGENSLASMAKKYHFALPESDYPDLLAAACELYAQHCAGNENCSVYTPLGKLIVNGLGAVLNYALDPLSPDDYAAVITWAFDTFDLPVNITPYLTQFASNTISESDVIEYIVLYAISPVFDDFMKDPTPADVSATLPACGKKESEVNSLIEKIRKFFNTIMLFLNSLFAFISRR